MKKKELDVFLSVLKLFDETKSKCISRKSGLKTWLKMLLKCFALDTLCSKAKHLKMSYHMF